MNLGKKICALLCAICLGLWALGTEAEGARALGGFFKQERQSSDTARDGAGEYELLHQSFAALSLDRELRQRYPALAQALDERAQQEWQQAQKTREAMKEEALAFRENIPRYYHPLSHKVDVLLRRADEQVVSFVSQEYTEGSGAHGFYSWQGVTLDTATGEKLHLAQVVRDASSMAELVAQKLRQDYPEGCYDDMEETVRKMALENRLNWSLDPRGITFYFNPYAVGPYAAGLMTATVLFRERPELFAEGYREGPASYAQPFSTWPPLTTSLSGGRDVLRLWREKEQLIIQVNGKKHSFRAELDDLHPVLICREGKNYLYIDGSLPEGNRMTLVFSLKGGVPRHLATLPYTFLHRVAVSPAEQRYWQFLTNPDGFYFDRSVSPGTSSQTDICALGEDGLLTFG